MRYPCNQTQEMNRIFTIPFTFLFSAFCFSFSGKIKVQAYDLKYIEKNLVHIPGASFNKGNCDSDQDYYAMVNNPCITVKVDTFYIFNQEITNGFYRLFMYDTWRKGDSAAYHHVLPDTLVWRDKMNYNEFFVEYYLRHPVFHDYPVVGLSHTQCLLFCDWLTEQYNGLPGRKFKKVKFDLPSEEEWEYAAHGGKHENVFPWDGFYMQNRDKRFRGDWMANFMPMDQASIGRYELETVTTPGQTQKNTYYIGYAGPSTNATNHPGENGHLTAPTHSYWPNGYGLYNMAGNVEEYVKEKGISKGGSWHDPGSYLRITSREQYDSTSSASNERGFRIAMHLIE